MFRARQADSGFGVSTDRTNRRRYIRLPQVLPVEMRPLDAAAAPAGTALWQGFTRNISFDGACVEINHLDESTQTALRNGRQRVQIFINIPFPPQQITAVARIAWLQPTAVPHPQSCGLGIHYESIDPRQQRQLIRTARFMRGFPRIVAAALLALAGLLAYAQLQNYVMTVDTRQMVREFRETTAQYGQTLAALNKVRAERQLLEDLLQKSSAEQARLAQLLDRLTVQLQTTAPAAALESLRREKEDLNGQLTALRSEQARVEERRHQQQVVEQSLAARADDWKKEKNRAASQSTPLLLAWLYSQQGQGTGLVRSYDGDPMFEDVGFTYDQALCAMTFVNQGEYARAARIFAFFRDRALRQAGSFFNAYDSKSGAVAEYTVHTGPSIYLALAILAYEDASHDVDIFSSGRRYRGLGAGAADQRCARRIARRPESILGQHRAYYCGVCAVFPAGTAYDRTEISGGSPAHYGVDARARSKSPFAAPESGRTGFHDRDGCYGAGDAGVYARGTGVTGAYGG